MVIADIIPNSILGGLMFSHLLLPSFLLSNVMLGCFNNV